MRGMILTARQENFRIVFTEGANETILRACNILVDEGIASPILVGREGEVREAIERLRFDLGGVPVVDPTRSPRVEAYAEEYFRMRRRRGIMRGAASQRLRQQDYFGAMMIHSGDADMMIAGASHHYVESLRIILEVIGPAAGIGRVSSHYLVLRPQGAVLLADCAVNIDPNAQELAEIALLVARMAHSLGIEPRVAMLSFSNFGSVDHPLARKVREATAIAKERAPDLVIDGEMQLATALNSSIRLQHFPFSNLEKDANVLIFPGLHSGNLALQLLENVGGAVPIGPILMGTRLPAHLLQYGATAEEVVNLVAIGIVEAAALRREA
jgi:malate dehydrogenase (oxaloacetate-decarboxylating)(NADP+)